MKSYISSCSIWQNIDSSISVTNPDGTSVEFRTPNKKGKTFDDYYTELRTLADAYIAAFAQSHPSIEIPHQQLTEKAA